MSKREETELRNYLELASEIRSLVRLGCPPHLLEQELAELESIVLHTEQPRLRRRAAALILEHRPLSIGASA